MAAVVLDAADIRGLAAFYQALLGGEVSGDDGWLELTRDGAQTLCFQPAPDHVPPQWPDGSPQQIHLNFLTPDLGAAHAHAMSVGARRLEAPGQPPDDAEHGYRVYADPAGHPFCLCW